MATHTQISDLRDRIGSDSGVAGMERVAQSDDLSLLDFLVVLVDRKRLIFWITAAFTLMAIPVSLLLPKRYTATVTVLPPQQNSSLGTMLAAQLGSMGSSSGLSGLGGMAALAGGSLGLKNPNDRYVGMLRSRIVEDAVIQRFALQQEYKRKYLSDARKTFERRADVDGNAKDGMIHISVQDRDPHKAAEMANGYVDEFRRLSQSLAIGEASRRRLFFEQQLEQTKDKLADAEEAMKQTEQSTGLIQLDSQARALIETVASLRAQIAAHEMIIQGMQTYATDQNSQLVQAEQELASLRAQLTKLGGSEQSSDNLIVPKGLVPEAGLEYLRKIRDVKYYETIFEILARQYELAKLDEAREGEIIQVVDPAVVPDKRSFPKRTYIVLGSFAAGFLIAILAAFASAAMERMERDPESAVKLNRIYSAFSLGAFTGLFR
jgi:tyrosine-protein kinase Etk/Wzc